MRINKNGNNNNNNDDINNNNINNNHHHNVGVGGDSTTARRTVEFVPMRSTLLASQAPSKPGIKHKMMTEAKSRN